MPFRHRAPSMRSMVTIACALALGAAVLSVPTRAFGAGPARCTTSQLRVDKTGENDATSHRGIEFALRNVSSTTCTLRGYPSMRLLDGAARSMPDSIAHFGGPPNGPAIHTVTLKPWHRAFFGIYFAVSGPCPAAVYAWGVRFTPPGAARGVVWYAGRFDLCGPGPARVQISPLRASPQF